MSTTGEKITFEALKCLAGVSSAIKRECSCAIVACAGWERVPASFPEELLQPVGTLLTDPYDEPTFKEHHPGGTNYWSVEAPIAVRHFPYNRCSVQQCAACGRFCLRYTEAGGYYVEPRVRALNFELLVDAILE